MNWKMKNRELILRLSRGSVREQRVSSGRNHEETNLLLDIPVHGLLEFLAWEERFRNEDILRGITTNFDKGGLSTSWILERLMHESYIVAHDGILDTGLYLDLRNSIVCIDLDEHPRDIVCSLRKSFLASNTAIEPLSSCSSYTAFSPRVLSDDSDDGSDDAGDDKDHHLRRTRRLMHRLSQAPRNSFPYQLVYSPTTHTVTGLCEHAPSRAFKFDKFLADPIEIVSNGAVAGFINGQSYCVILTGHEASLVNTLKTVAVNIVGTSRGPIIRRSECLGEKLSCDVKLSLIRFFRNKMDVLWSTDSFPEAGVLEEQIENLTGLTGHLVFEMSLKFQFSRPYDGEHLSRFVVCIPSQPERARRGLSLDLLALKNCLRAIKSDSAFIPSRDSVLTHWLALKQFSQIHLVTAVNDSTDTSRNESINGLRFAEHLA
jgi:hypothetical protein